MVDLKLKQSKSTYVNEWLWKRNVTKDPGEDCAPVRVGLYWQTLKKAAGVVGELIITRSGWSTE